MSVGFQESLFDDEGGEIFHPIGGRVQHHELSRGAWVDFVPGWLGGSAALFDRLHAEVPWRAERRQMYDRVVDVPRLMRMYGEAEPLPDPLLAQARTRLSRHYRTEQPDGFATVGLNLYRTGDDSVAWHGDRIGRGAVTDVLVAILSLGAPRQLLLRPMGGGRSLRFTTGPGDLLVMGGSCQRTWEHAVPKVRGAGPRISVQFRPRGVN